MDKYKEREITYFARTNWRGENKRFGIRLADRRYHMYIIGKTGTGKSTLLHTLTKEDLRLGYGLCLIDPHGDLAGAVRASIPPERQHDLIDFDVPNKWKELGFNPLSGVLPEDRALAASNILEVFKKTWSAFWGPRLEHILRNSIITLLAQPSAHFGDILRLLSDSEYRKRATGRIANEQVRSFWRNEFEKYPTRLRADSIAPIQNKVGAFLTNPILGHILIQPVSTMDLRDMMDTGKILLVNLSKGRLGEDTTFLLGALLVSMINTTAMGRGSIPEEKRRDFFLYMDEFQSFTTGSIATMLSELRKYRVSLILAHQFLSQLTTSVRDAILGNIGTLICFRVGPVDAGLLAREFEPEVEKRDLLSRQNYHIYLKMMIESEVSEPFSALTLNR